MININFNFAGVFRGLTSVFRKKPVVAVKPKVNLSAINDILAMDISVAYKLELIAEKLHTEEQLIFINKISGISVTTLYHRNLDLINPQQYSMTVLPVFYKGQLVGSLGYGKSFNVTMNEQLETVVKSIGKLIVQLG